MRLPDFPWDTLAPHARTARAHPGGIVDLSVGTPVDPTPDVAQRALAAAADAPGYPTTRGTDAVREAVAAWFARCRGVPGVDPARAVLPTVGSKELVAWLPLVLGLGPGDAVAHPPVAYPTYEVGARLARAEALPLDAAELADGVPERVRLVWLNSPSNPTGRVLGVDELAGVVAAARAAGAVVVSDECYAELPWDEPWASSGVPGVLDPRVCGGSHEGLLAVTSLSKRSNLAGYRAGAVTGDPALVDTVHEVRRHAGLMVPAPVQAAMTAALADDAHVEAQRRRYRARRDALRPAFEAAGFRVEHSEAGLYLWARAPEGLDAWGAVEALARLGILVAPGTFYGEGGAQHVRVALTAPDDRVEAAVSRLTSGDPAVAGARGTVGLTGSTAASGAPGDPRGPGDIPRRERR